MRTTITLEDDVAADLKAYAREHDLTFKQAVNRAVRAGLQPPSAERESEPFVVRSRPMGVLPGVDITHATRLAGELEDEEILRKMALGK